MQRIAALSDAEAVGWRQLVEVFSSLAEDAVAYVPKGVTYRSEVVGQVPVELFTPPMGQGFLLFLHGGNYLLPVCDPYRYAAEAIAIRAGKTVVLVDYAVAPYVYPDALGEVYGVWEWLYRQDDRICLMGDGSGANLALQLAFMLKEEAVRQPKGLVLLSPQTDMTCSGNSYYDNFYLDPIYGKKKLSGLDIPDAYRASPMWAYCADCDLASPEISPLFADLKGLPPCFITVGSHEVLLDDAVRFAAVAREANVDVTLTVGEGLCYAYPFFYRQFAEAKSALDALCAFLHKR
jgi:acetyl esterase/lipase